MTYWVVIKKVVDNGAYVPIYEIHTSPPSGHKAKVIAALEPGYCVELYKCKLSQDSTYVIVNQFLVSNNEGILEEKLTETYFLNREGK